MRAKWIVFLVAAVLIIGVPLFFYFQPNIRHLELTDRDHVFLGPRGSHITDLFEFDSNLYRVSVHHYASGHLVMEEEVGVFGGYDGSLLAFTLEFNEYETEHARLISRTSNGYLGIPIYFDFESASVTSWPFSAATGSTFRVDTVSREVIAMYELSTSDTHFSVNLPNITIDLDLEFMRHFDMVDHAIFISVERVE